MARKRKAFEELTITDDFMFGAVMSDPRRCKRLLESIFGIKIERIEYPERQKAIDISYESKSVRLDVYVEDEKHTVYNIEMQTSQRGDLSRRIRYYHDMIDLNIIDKGEDYTELKKSFVIFICTYDPFGKDLYRYTFEKQCREDPAVFLEDEATSIVLNCAGHIGDINDELISLLHYMAGQEPQGGLASDVAKGVAEVHKSEKWRREYMTLTMKFREERKIGIMATIVSSIRGLRNLLPYEKILEVLHISHDEYNVITTSIDNSPDKTDEDIAEEILGYTDD